MIGLRGKALWEVLRMYDVGVACEVRVGASGLIEV